MSFVKGLVKAISRRRVHHWRLVERKGSEWKIIIDDLEAPMTKEECGDLFQPGYTYYMQGVDDGGRVLGSKAKGYWWHRERGKGAPVVEGRVDSGAVQSYIMNRFGEVGEMTKVMAEAIAGLRELAFAMYAPPQQGGEAGETAPPLTVKDQVKNMLKEYQEIKEIATAIAGPSTAPGPGWPDFEGKIPAYFHPYVMKVMRKEIEGVIDYIGEKVGKTLAPTVQTEAKQPSIKLLTAKEFIKAGRKPEVEEEIEEVTEARKLSAEVEKEVAEEAAEEPETKPEPEEEAEE